MGEEEQPKKKKEKKPKSKVRKILEWVFTGIFLAAFAFFGVMFIVGQVSKKENHNVPNYGGIQILDVMTDSMEPKYKVNSVVFVKKVDVSTFKVGDDITFMWRVNNTEMPMTHRLVEIKTPEEHDGVHYLFTAHGINTNSNQCNGDCTYQTQTFEDTKVLGKVVGHSIVIGAVFNFMIKPWGLLILLLIPALYLIITSVIDIVKAAGDNDDDKVVAEASEASGEGALSKLSKDDIERLKQDMLNEMIEEKQKAKEKEGKTNEKE